MAGRVITALVEHKFDMSKMESLGEDEYCFGPLISIVHKNVNLSFQLGICAKDPREDHKDHLGVYVHSVDGPTDILSMDIAMFVAKGPEGEPVWIQEGKDVQFQSMNGWGAGKILPGTLEGLRRAGFVSVQDTLHAFAILFIPEAAFEDPANKCPASSAQNSFRHHLYLQTETPATTNSPVSNRFEMISNDGHHFWVHKEVLAFNCDAFEHMFDPEKPDAVQFDYLREGRMTLGNASGGALKEMITYLYLQHTTPDFDQFAMELVPLAEMYGLKGLGLLCVQTLIVVTKNEKDIGVLLHLLEFAHLHELPQLGEKSVQRLGEVVKEQNDVDRELLLKVTEHAHKHGYGQLKSVSQQKLIQHVNECGNLTVAIIIDLATEAGKYLMNALSLACGRWLINNWEEVANNGQLSDVMKDETGGLFTRLMALATDFDQFAMELVPLAEMYGLKGLGLLCVQTLIVVTKNEKDIGVLLHLLEFAHLHELPQLEKKSVQRLREVLKEQNDVDSELLLKVTEHAHKHGYGQLKTVSQQKLIQHVNECGNLTVAIIHSLATEARKYGLNEMFVACGRWLTNNWEKVAKNGQLRDVMRDETGGLFTQMMAAALKKK